MSVTNSRHGVGCFPIQLSPKSHIRSNLHEYIDNMSLQSEYSLHFCSPSTSPPSSSRTSSALESLPVELQTQVYSLLPNTDSKNVRLTCKALMPVAESFLFDESRHKHRFRGSQDPRQHQQPSLEVVQATWFELLSRLQAVYVSSLNH